MRGQRSYDRGGGYNGYPTSQPPQRREANGGSSSTTTSNPYGSYQSSFASAHPDHSNLQPEHPGRMSADYSPRRSSVEYTPGRSSIEYTPRSPSQAEHIDSSNDPSFNARKESYASAGFARSPISSPVQSNIRDDLNDDHGYSSRVSYGDRHGSYGDRHGSYGDRQASYGERQASYGDRMGPYGDKKSSTDAYERKDSYGDRKPSNVDSQDPYARDVNRSSDRYESRGSYDRNEPKKYGNYSRNTSSYAEAKKSSYADAKKLSYADAKAGTATSSYAEAKKRGYSRQSGSKAYSRGYKSAYSGRASTASMDYKDDHKEDNFKDAHTDLNNLNEDADFPTDPYSNKSDPYSEKAIEFPKVSKEKYKDYAPSRYTDLGNLRGLAALKEIFNNIKYDWPQMLNEQANPIEMAVALLDDTSIGLAHKYGEFDDIKTTTSKALREVVNEQYEVFNSSIRSYHALLPMLDKAELDAADIHTMLETSTTQMHTNSEGLNDLNGSQTRMVEMIEILDAIDQVVKIPDRVDDLVADNKIHLVYDVVSEGFLLGEKYRLWSLPALVGVHQQLEQLSNGMVDMIIDELHQEIYSKQMSLTGAREALITSNNPQLVSFRNLTESTSLEQFIYNSANLDSGEIADVLLGSHKKFISRQLPRLHQHTQLQATKSGEVDFSAVLDTQATQSSESYVYMYLLLSTAAKLGRLGQVTTVLVQRCQSELHQLVNRCTDFVKSMDQVAIDKLSKLKSFDHQSVVIGDLNFQDAAVTVLIDLFGTVFSQALLVLQKHQVVASIAPLLEPKASYEINKVWRVLRKELGVLVDNYIYNSARQTDVIHTNIKNPIVEVNMTQDLFKFKDAAIPTRSAKELSAMVQDMFPSFSLEPESSTDHTTPYIESESFNAMVEVLVPKDLFNMRIIMEFCLVFIAGADMLGITGGTLEDGTKELAPKPLFNQLMQTKFLDRVNDNLSFLFAEVIGREYQFKVETVTLNPNKDAEVDKLAVTRDELLKSTTVIYQNAFEFRKVWTTVCMVLNTSFRYRKNYSPVALGFLQKFASAYSRFYNELIATDVAHQPGVSQKPVSQISKWLKVPSLVDISSILLNAGSEDAADKSQLVQKEVTIMFATDPELLGASPDDFLDDESFDQLCYLLLTGSWLLGWLPEFKTASMGSGAPTNGDLPSQSSMERLKAQWQFLETGKLNSVTSSYDTVQLALDSDHSIKFDEVVRGFETMTDHALLAIRYDIRVKALHYVGQSFTNEDWCPPNEPADADRFVSTLNKEIYSLNNKLTQLLPDEQRQLVYLGLDVFLTKVLIQGSFLIKKVNKFGIKRVMLNIFILQQMVRNLTGYADYDRSVNYFEMFMLSEYSFLPEVRENVGQYSKQEYLNMARLMHSEKLADGGGSQFARSKYQDLMKKIEGEYRG